MKSYGNFLSDCHEIEKCIHDLQNRVIFIWMFSLRIIYLFIDPNTWCRIHIFKNVQMIGMRIYFNAPRCLSMN